MATDNRQMGLDFTTASDASLAMAVARWEEDALAEVYRRHARSLLGLANRLLGDARASEDVVQEVFVRFWHRPDRFDPDRGSLRAFLAAETHGRSIDLVRAESSRRKREGEEAASPRLGASIEHEFIEGAVAAQVRRAVADLPIEEKQAVELAYFGGLTYKEVADALTEPEGTVKSRIRRALARLHQDLIGVRQEEEIR